MHDHQFNFDSEELTKDQINQAKTKINQFAKQASIKLGQMKILSDPSHQSVNNQIKTLAAHAQNNLRNLSIQSQVDLLLKRTDLQLKQLIVGEQLKMMTQLVINRITQSSLTSDHRATAVDEIKNAKRFAMDDMKKATNNIAIKSAFAMGINAINGALAKYVADSQINAIDQVKSLVRRYKDNLVKNDQLTGEIRAIIAHKLDEIKQSSVDDLLTSVNFVQLTKVRQQCISRIKAIISNQQGFIKSLISFDQFMRQVDDVIISLSLSSNDKMQIESQINQYHDNGITKLTQSSKIKSEYLTSIKHQITTTIVNAMSRHYQQMISGQALTLNKTQRQKLIDQLRRTTVRINQRPLTGPIKASLMKALRQLSSIVQQRKSLIYQDQLKHVINRINVRIDQLYDVSQTDQNYLKSQVISFSRQVKNHESDLSTIAQSLQTFFRTQCKFVQQFNLQSNLTKLLRQIRYSYLTKSQKQALTQRLEVVKHNAHLNYSNKQLFIKNLNDYGLKLDCARSCQWLNELGQTLSDHVDALTKLSLRSKFSQLQSEFNYQTASASQMATVNHQTQLIENEMCRNAFQLSSTIKSTGYQLSKMVDHAHTVINSAVLQPNLKQLVNDKLDKFENVQLISLLQTHDVNDRSTKIARKIKSQLEIVLTIVKHTYAQRISNLARRAHYQLMAESINSYVGDLNRISSHAELQIKNANDLQQTEAAMQQGWRQMNVLSNHVIDKLHPAKAQAHQQIHKLLVVTKDRMNNHVDLLTDNRFLMAVNQADEQINWAPSEQINNVYIHCQSILDQILRKNYLCKWSNITELVLTRIVKLTRVPVDAKAQAIKLVRTVNQRVITDLKETNSAKLSNLVRDNRKKIQAIINQISYMDPAKRKIRTKLAKLINQTKQYAKQYQSDQAKHKTLQVLYRISYRLNCKLSKVDDHQLQQIYQINRERLISYQLRIIRQARLKHFELYFKYVENKAQALKLQANRDTFHAEAKFNQCYHKTRYNIQYSSNPKVCIHNEQAGEQRLDKIMMQCKASSLHKQRIYSAILDKLEHAEYQIKDLRYVQDKDKKSGLKLLKQIQQVTVHQVKNASTRKQIFTIEHHSYQAIEQILNNVVSAGVILAAIQSANNRIEQSHLDSHQKANALQQIHQIINNGLKAQTIQSTRSNVQYKNHRSFTKSGSNHVFAPRQMPKENPLVTLISTIIHFFRWLFGKLAQEL